MILALLLLFASPLHAISPDTAANLITPLQDAVYAQVLTAPEVERLYQTTLSGIDAVETTREEKLYLQALAHYYFGRSFQSLKNIEEMTAYAADLRAGRYLRLRDYYTERSLAMDAYRKARTAAEAYLEKVSDAEAHRLYGEILGQIDRKSVV